MKTVGGNDVMTRMRVSPGGLRWKNSVLTILPTNGKIENTLFFRHRKNRKLTIFSVIGKIEN